MMHSRIGTASRGQIVASYIHYYLRQCDVSLVFEAAAGVALVGCVFFLLPALAAML